MGVPSFMLLSGTVNRRKLTHKVNIGEIVTPVDAGGMRSTRLGKRRESRHLTFIEKLLSGDEWKFTNRNHHQCSTIIPILQMID